MKNKGDSPYDALEKIFHEPNRLSIMSALCAADNGLSFGQLKEECSLTDGNLSRHLKVLEKADAIQVEKAFVDSKPRTTVRLSKNGITRFEEYLSALNEVLKKAKDSMPARKRSGATLPLGKTATA